MEDKRLTMDDVLTQALNESEETERRLRIHITAISDENARLTAELSQERRRADRAEQKMCVMCGHQPGMMSYGR